MGLLLQTSGARRVWDPLLELHERSLLAEACDALLDKQIWFPPSVRHSLCSSFMLALPGDHGDGGCLMRGFIE